MIEVRINCEDGHEISVDDLVTVEVCDCLMHRGDYKLKFVTQVCVKQVENGTRLFLRYENDPLAVSLTRNKGASDLNVMRWIHKGPMTKKEADRDIRMKSIVDQITTINTVNRLAKIL